MATREGIYVGSKDIIERYVGNKLVWSKWIRIGSVRSINSPNSCINGYFQFIKIYQSSSLWKRKNKKSKNC